MERYSQGDRVLYGIHGVCSVLDIIKRNVDRRIVEYYVLAPMDQTDSRFYVPTENPAAVAKMRPVMQKEQIRDLLNTEAADTWVPDEARRKTRYRELICSADTAALLAMVRNLYLHREQQTAAGRKFHLCDENFLRDAEKILLSEFCAVLGMQQAEVLDMIRKSVNK